ncbi:MULTISPECIES: hypothetical protein [Mycoplasma mycoides group]|uniref:hypothetical protein n=1 Tax=Mycoplasma mycoides group TaxID=656088 RepID=UPI00223F9F68|nr:hypothetical protein [Mycoplasma mycoides]
MSSVKFRIINKYQIQLLEDANKGSIIDLNKADQIDLSIISDQINNHKDQIYLEKLKQEKQNWELLKTNEQQKFENDLMNEYNKKFKTTSIEISNLQATNKTLNEKIENNKKEFLKDLENNKKIWEANSEKKQLNEQEKLIKLQLENQYNILLNNDIKNEDYIKNKDDIEYKNDIEYRNRKKKLIQIVGFSSFYSFDDLIYNNWRHLYDRWQLKKRKDELLLIKDNIYNINFNYDSKDSSDKKVIFFYNRGNEIYKYIISDISYDEKDVVNFLTSKSKDSKDTFDVRNATITKIKVE